MFSSVPRGVSPQPNVFGRAGPDQTLRPPVRAHGQWRHLRPQARRAERGQVVDLFNKNNPDAEPLTLAANYGTKVTITPFGPDAKRVNGLKFDVTPPPPL